MLLSDLIDRLQSKKITVRGAEVTLTAPTVANVRRALAHVTRPVAPMAPSTRWGSNAPWEPNEGDPRYVAARADFIRIERRTHVALASDWKTRKGVRFADCGDDAAVKAWAEDAVRELEEAFNPIELSELWNHVVTLGATVQTVEEAGKNS